MLRLDGYIRVSRVGGREGEGYISPDVQRESILAYAGELGGTIVAWHDDQDFTGGNTERPGFEAMLGRLEAGESDGIVVMKVDRFARSTAEGASIVKEIVGRGQIFASCHERFDPKTPEGAFMLRAFLSNAELFLDQIKASWATAKGRAISRGAHIGPTPTGYLKVDPMPSKPTHISPVDSAAMGGPTGPGVLVPHPVYGPAIEALFERAATGDYGPTALSRWMTETAPRDGGASWSPTEINRWLANRIYLGEVRNGRLVNSKAHQRLTDEETFLRAQREPGEQRRGASPFLLAGLIRCAGCRYAMGGNSNTGGPNAAVYRCYRRSRGCPASAVVTARRIDDHLTQLVLAKQRGVLIGQSDSAEDDRDIMAFENAAEEVEVFVGDVDARRLMGDVLWHDGLAARVAERDRLKPAHDAALARVRARELAQRTEADVDRHGLRDLLVGMVRHVFVRPGARGAGEPVANRVLVIWADDPRAIDIPGRHNRKVFEPIGW